MKRTKDGYLYKGQVIVKDVDMDMLTGRMRVFGWQVIDVDYTHTFDTRKEAMEYIDRCERRQARCA